MEMLGRAALLLMTAGLCLTIWHWGVVYDRRASARRLRVERGSARETRQFGLSLLVSFVAVIALTPVIGLVTSGLFELMKTDWPWAVSLASLFVAVLFAGSTWLAERARNSFDGQYSDYATLWRDLVDERSQGRNVRTESEWRHALVAVDDRLQRSAALSVGVLSDKDIRRLATENKTPLEIVDELVDTAVSRHRGWNYFRAAPAGLVVLAVLVGGAWGLTLDSPAQRVSAVIFVFNLGGSGVLLAHWIGRRASIAAARLRLSIDVQVRLCRWMALQALDALVEVRGAQATAVAATSPVGQGIGLRGPRDAWRVLWAR